MRWRGCGTVIEEATLVWRWQLMKVVNDEDIVVINDTIIVQRERERLAYNDRRNENKITIVDASNLKLVKRCKQ